MAYCATSSIVANDEYPQGCTWCISENGDLYSFGCHEDLAHGHSEEFIFPPLKVTMLHQIIAVDCGDYHCICLNVMNEVFAFGSNKFLQLGFGKTVSQAEPQKVNLPPIKQISCGRLFSVFLTLNGDLYTCGANSLGQLGYFTDIDIPKKIDYLHDIDFVRCGSEHAICKTNNDDIYVWGCNNVGQLGIGDVHGEGIMKHHTTAYKAIKWPTGIVDIKCGVSHTLVLTENKEVYSCGSNAFGQLGRNVDESRDSLSLSKLDSISNIVRIECGSYHSMCIDTSNDLFVFGDNECGQLGLFDVEDENYKEKVMLPTKIPSISNIIDISSRGYHTFVKTSDNKIFGFGENEYLQLGVETEFSKQYKPIQTLEDNESLWSSTFLNFNRKKSARK